MRLLVVGGSSLMAWVVRPVVPDAVEVEHVTTFPGVRDDLCNEQALCLEEATPR